RSPVIGQRRCEARGRRRGAQCQPLSIPSSLDMIPLSFGTSAARLHLPKDGVTPSGIGVVIVPPHGIEALAAAKSLRLLAEALAAGGHAALRFDLPGTGDSLDDDLPPDATSSWIEAVIDAASTLRSNSGVSGIVLAGLRSGALLAASAALRVDGLSGLVLLDPV